MLAKDPNKRMTAQEALNHVWIKETSTHLLNDDTYTEVLKRLQRYSGKSKLRLAAINIMVKQLSDDQFDK